MRTDSQIVVDLPRREIMLDCLKKECLACRACPIGGRGLDGSEWNWDGESEPSPISNVFSSGDVSCELVVVGQNPGRDEVLVGRPFIGASGRFFDKVLLEEVGLGRDQVYVTNVVKCFTPGNRAPTPEEVGSCQGFLRREFEIVKPKMVLALGSYAFRALTGMSGITKHCGEIVHSIRFGVPVLACLHPSPYNTNNPEKRGMFMSALGVLRAALDA